MVFDPQMSSDLTSELRDIVQQIEAQARSFGLDFFPVIFEMVDYNQMSAIASYGGFPTRYPHWRFGMEFEQLSKSYEYGLSLIYEMVINNDPCYAYLLKSNSLVDQKTVIAHVFAHCDFFKNNYCFAHTNRKMLDEMANHGSRVRRYIEEVGQDEVEDFIDICLSLENLIDQHAPHIRRFPKNAGGTAVTDADAPVLPADRRPVHKLPSKGYMDSFVNPEEFKKQQQRRAVEESQREKNFPESPQRDVLQFLIEHAPLSAWQRDVLSIIREEAYYFAPQGQTKIMNEGWAVYWHSKMMTEFALTDAEIIDYCDHYAGVVATNGRSLNPYKVGVELTRHIIERWDRGQFGLDYVLCTDPQERRAWNKNAGLGMQKIFEVRKHHNDITFIDEFLDEDFCEKAKLFTWASDRKTGQPVIADRDFSHIKTELLDALTNFGQPMVDVIDGNFRNRGELLLRHTAGSQDLRVDWAMETLRGLYRVWNRPVHLFTLLEDEPKLVSFDGAEPRVEKAHISL